MILFISHNLYYHIASPAENHHLQLHLRLETGNELYEDLPSFLVKELMLDMSAALEVVVFKYSG